MHHDQQGMLPRLLTFLVGRQLSEACLLLLRHYYRFIELPIIPPVLIVFIYNFGILQDKNGEWSTAAVDIKKFAQKTKREMRDEKPKHRVQCAIECIRVICGR